MPKRVLLDSCIFVEAWTEGKYADFCSDMIRKYMNNKRESCYIPIIVPGETLFGILKETKDKERITTILRNYRNSFLNDNIIFIHITEDAIKIKEKLDQIYGIDEHDKFIVACGITAGCTEIITLDNNMYNQQSRIAKISKDLKNYKISINNPKFRDSIL